MMLQDIEPRRLVNEYTFGCDAVPDEKSLLIVRRGRSLLCGIDEANGRELRLPKAKHFEGNLQYLLAVDEVRFYMPKGTAEESGQKEESTRQEKGETESSAVQADFSFVDVKEIRYTAPDWLRYGALEAWQLAGWYQTNRYCGGCGKPMAADRKERCVRCVHCGNLQYPKLCPVIIAGIVNGEKILLSKYAGPGTYRRYALIAGFAEIGETIEQTVAREVMEETGLKVKNLKYYKSQPWAYSDSLLFGFFCEAEGETEIRIDENELSMACWSSREEIPDYEGEISLTHEMMSRFKKYGRAVLGE